MQFTGDMKLYFHGSNGDGYLSGHEAAIGNEADIRSEAAGLAREFVEAGSGDEDWTDWKIVASTEPDGQGIVLERFDFEELGVWSPTANLAKVYQEALSQAREYAAKWGDYYEEYADDDGFNDRLLKEAAYDILGSVDFADDAYENPTAEPLTDEGKAKLDAVFEGLGYADRATDGNVWGDVIEHVADRLGLIPATDDNVHDVIDIDDVERVSEIVWDANTPEEARELALEAGIVGEENLLKSEGIWFRDEWNHYTAAFEELFPTYGEGSRATDPNDFLEDDFQSIVDGDLSAREASNWWKDYGKRLHDVEETIREYGLVYDGDTDGDFETRVHQLEAWLNEHTVEPHLPFVTPPECQGQALEYSYSLVENRGRTFIIEREHDHGDGEIVHRLYMDGDPDGEFAPQNGAPKLGEFVGMVVVEKQIFPTAEEIASFGNGVRIGR